ncbi:MAG: TMEM165/GDT1 family protein [Actinomycetota bacterium]|nr:TMEM165/GDT1 family protein [Actinomycetota bacterium]
MSLTVALICFPVVFLGELPDKTMFANLIMATRARPQRVWLGAAGAFVVHVTIAVTIGAAVFELLPHRAVDAVVAGMFLAGATWAWHTRRAEAEADGAAAGVAGQQDREEAVLGPSEPAHGAVLTAFAVIFLAEWGDLTQILIANLAARYHAPLSVAIGSLLALWVVAAIAVTGGQAFAGRVGVRTVRTVTAVVLLALAGYSALAAAR